MPSASPRSVARGLPASADNEVPEPAAGTAGRARRSRLDRPCDTCRRHKHLCVIPVRNEPCSSCKARERPCTFEIPPTARKRNSMPGSTRGRGRATASETNRDESTQDHSTAVSRGPPGIVSTHDFGVYEPSHAPMLTTDNTSRVQLHAPKHNVGPVPQLDGLTDQTSDGMWRGQRHHHVQPNSIEDDLEPQDTLDPDLEKREESHFVGTGAISGLTLDEMDSSELISKTLSFRQVSRDTKLPAFFVKHPSLMYDRPDELVKEKQAYEAICRECQGLMRDVTGESLSLMRRVVLPALPFIDGDRLASECLGIDGTGPIPYALVGAIIAHCNVFFPAIRPLGRQLWVIAKSPLSETYLIPRLRTIQCAICVLISRPAENAGQSDNVLSTAVATAQTLGLHINPSNWKIPSWERSMRKRLWWCLLIHDKWRALLFGRPSKINQNNHNVPIPQLEDFHNDQAGFADRLSLETFFAACRLSLIAEKTLDSFFTVQQLSNPSTVVQRVTKLEEILLLIDDFEQAIPKGLQWSTKTTGIISTLPTGIRSFQVSLFGLKAILYRLMLDCVPNTASLAVESVQRRSLAIAVDAVNLVAALSAEDRALFWMPYTPHHVSNVISLLVRLCVRTANERDAQAIDSVHQVAVRETIRLMIALNSMVQQEQWDIANLAIKRSAFILFKSSQKVPALEEIYRATSSLLGNDNTGESLSLAKSLMLTMAEATLSIDDFLISLGLNPNDASSWYSDPIQSDSLSWLNVNGAPDAPEIWDHGVAGMVGSGVASELLPLLDFPLAPTSAEPM